MKDLRQRTIFVVLTTAVVVFFSEKTYWYPQGYAIGELILYYAFPVFACLWAIERFRVRTLPALILAAALFAFLVEGVLTPVIYEAGLLDPLMPAYFIGWHGLLSVVFGWYLLRKWLVRGQWGWLLAGGTLFGLFWGLWSVTYWLPESIVEFEQLAAEGEPVITGMWSMPEFGWHALTFTLMLIFAHWLLGRGGWQPTFQPGKAEKWLVALALIFFFSVMVLPTMLSAIFKLAAMLGVVFFALRANRRQEEGESLLAELTGPVKFSHALILLVMPLAATGVYALSALVQSSEEIIRVILEVTPLLQGFVGGGMFVWALVMTLRPRRMPEAVNPL